jgi:hypothetical protein
MKPWLGMVLSVVLWDTFTAATIMSQATIKGMGVFTAVELFDELIDSVYGLDDIGSISTLARVQIARAVGVAIVVHGSMHPSMVFTEQNSASDPFNVGSSSLFSCSLFVRQTEVVFFGAGRSSFCATPYRGCSYWVWRSCRSQALWTTAAAFSKTWQKFRREVLIGQTRPSRVRGLQTWTNNGLRPATWRARQCPRHLDQRGAVSCSGRSRLTRRVAC